MLTDMQKDYKKTTLAILPNLAKEIIEISQDIFTKENRACIIFLQGDLGAGKTTFTKELAKLLNIEEEVISPTFVLRKDYPNLIHIDGYRFENGNEAKVLEIYRELDKRGLLIVIEWPERFVEEINLNPDISLHFQALNETERNISINIH